VPAETVNPEDVEEGDWWKNGSRAGLIDEEEQEKRKAAEQRRRRTPSRTSRLSLRPMPSP
jgi:hypothetical protein